MGVGSVLGHNNAQIAVALGAPVVLVANAGVGSTIDQLLLNAALCAEHGATSLVGALGPVIQSTSSSIRTPACTSRSSSTVAVNAVRHAMRASRSI